MLTNEIAPNEQARQEPIELPDGWSGEVLTGWRDANVSVPAWREALNHLVSGTHPNERTVLKHSKTTNLFRTRMDLHDMSIDVVCKHILAKGRNRTTRQWNCAMNLARLRINTALPLAHIERTTPTREAWIVTQAIPDVVDLERIASGLLNEIEPTHARKVKRALTELVVELCHQFEDARLFHRDFKASNILVSDWDGRDAAAKLWMVDLDGIHRRRFYHRDPAWRAITRLAASLVDFHALTRTDFLRFLRAHSKSWNSHADQWKPQWRRLDRSVTDYNRRSQRRKRGKIDGFSGT